MMPSSINSSIFQVIKAEQVPYELLLSALTKYLDRYCDLYQNRKLAHDMSYYIDDFIDCLTLDQVEEIVKKVISNSYLDEDDQLELYRLLSTKYNLSKGGIK